MKQPTSIKDVQRLTGKIVGLNRSLLKYIEISLIFFQTLKDGKSFEWTSECQKAFEALKEHLNEVLLLTRLEIGESIFIYLEVSDTTISAVLLKNDGQMDRLVYYVNKVLQGLET